MRCRSLTVLMWKHLVVRRRRFIHTIVELISPILFMLIFLAFKVTRDDETFSNVSKPKALNDLSSPEFLLYSPDTKATRKLMDDVGAKLGLKRLTDLAVKTSDTIGYLPYSNVSEIAKIANKMEWKDAIIIFQDAPADHWEGKLDYTIRMSGRSTPSPYSGHLPKYGDGDGDFSAYEVFLKLQWAIDSSYTDELARTKTSIIQQFQISLQKFPYYGKEPNEEITYIRFVLIIINVLSLFIVFVFMMSRLLEERASGIQELIKMGGVTSNTLSLSHFLNVVPTGLMYAVFSTVLLKSGDNPIVQHSNGIIIFIAAILYFVTVAAMATACSYLATSTQYTVSISVFAYILLFVPSQLITSFPLVSYAAVRFSGLLPHVPMSWLWNEISAFEYYRAGLSFADITRSHTSSSGPVLLGLGWMVVQSALFFFIAWYLSHVRPGNYGQSMPWNFLFQKQYWTQNEIKPEFDNDDEGLLERDNKFFEDTPKDLDVGIKVENISKIFPKQKALSNVSLEVYKGEFTILLGHNGAGKTTLMSIITGMMSATEGKIYVNGLDSVKQRDQVRKQLGLCPQHNLFFPDLTVLEHAMFFTLLKGGSWRGARASALALLRRLGVASKARSRSAELSGGMQRRLQLACALAGGASVLVLDEPTSGLDVETRRELWDLLLSLRGERTVLLTTHFMEEADALGDRVAALHLGQLRCHATPMHLKKAIGTGYRLTFTTNGVPRDAAVSSVVTSFVPDASVKEKTINSLSYNLPAAASAQFPTLFTMLEERKSVLGIDTIGVGVSTLEDVFLKLCTDTFTTFIDDIEETGRIPIYPTYNKVTGPSLYLRQCGVLLKRQYTYVRSKLISFLILQALLPVLSIFAITGLLNNYQVPRGDGSQPEITLDFDLYSFLPERKVLYNMNPSSADASLLENMYPNVGFISDKNITEVILETGMKSMFDYNNLLIGIEINNTTVKALYSTVYRHAAPVALSALSNVIAAQLLPPAAGRAITARNHPLHGAVTYDAPLARPKSTELCIMWTVFIVFIILSTNINFASLPCRERVSGSRHLHVMAGCPAALHWLCTLAFHALACLAVLVLAAAVAAASVDTDRTLAQPDMILTLMLILTLGSMAFFALMYSITFFFAERATMVIAIALLILFGILSPIFMTIRVFYPYYLNGFEVFCLNVCWLVMPPHTLALGVAKCVRVAQVNAICSLHRSCPKSKEFGINGEFYMKKCCAGEVPMNYLSTGDSPGVEIILLIIQTIVYMALVVLMQMGLVSKIRDRIFNRNMHFRNAAQDSDEILKAEVDYVNNKIALPKKQIEEANVAMLVSDVHKKYNKVIGKSCYAVQGLSFSVKKGECFGLLGVNGAGKSTTFKMLTTEECSTKGEIYANGHYIHEDKNQYLRSLGYCPQFFGLDDFQTGADNLKLLLTLRGLDSKDVSAEVESWIDVVGLRKYGGRNVSGYSGGCTRRLAAAAALSSGAPLALLDEPTAGVDVAARRRVWSALRRSLRMQRSVLITSHSMDEMEALCGRIGIMSGGVLRALGTPGELRARHAQGHAVVIKVKHRPRGDAEIDNGAKSEVDRLKSTLHSKFNCTKKDEHKTMLHYHINETMTYSDLFTKLENIKSTYSSLVEDYSVTETTLEEVFLSFAKEHQERSPPADNNGGVV